MTAPPAPRSHRLLMRVALARSPLDSRRGVVRLHPLVLDMLGMNPWDPLQLEGQRVTAALAASGGFDMDRGTVLLDDLSCVNAGVDPGDEVGITPAAVSAARTIALTGGPSSSLHPEPEWLRFALLGKVATAGDHVSLLPQDFSRPTDPGPAVDALVALSRALGPDWQRVVLQVAHAEPVGIVRVTMETVVTWGGASTLTGAAPLGSGGPTDAVPMADLAGLGAQAAQLKELLELTFHKRELLQRLGAPAEMGVLMSGPAGSGKAALVESVAAAVGAMVERLWGPALARLEANAAAQQLRGAFARARTSGNRVVLIEDVDAIAPRNPDRPSPLLAVLVEEISASVRSGRVAVVCTTAHPEATSTDLGRTGVLDHEITVPLPGRDDRRAILAVQTRRLPLAEDVSLDDLATRTPGFVSADIVALAREASLRAAQRMAAKPDSTTQQVTSADFDAALDVVQPSSLDGMTVEIAEMGFDDVGNLETVKSELEEAVIWPLRYPDTFSRLGIKPPRGMLLFGPPGCGKTFVIKALANEAAANFLSVKGAELLSKWVGESERAVRELFRRARDAQPALVFLDEIDSLAPVRGGGSSDSGVSERVVASLLTELDGVEDLGAVSVIGATNRPDLVDPALLRPGRLERLVYVPPPDAEARGLILKAAAKKIPLAPEIDLVAIAATCEGYSAADLAALAREAAMTAMRRDIAAALVTAADFITAAAVVRPSLRAEQVTALEAFAIDRARL